MSECIKKVQSLSLQYCVKSHSSPVNIFFNGNICCHFDQRDACMDAGGRQHLEAVVEKSLALEWVKAEDSSSRIEMTGCLIFAM